MRSTGFGESKPVPTVADLHHSKANNVEGVMGLYNNDVGQRAAAGVPGELSGSRPYASLKLTPQQGLVPGHMPISKSLDRAPKSNPFPDEALLNKPSYSGPISHPIDLRAIGVGKESDRNSPGQLAQAPPTGFGGKVKTSVEKMIASTGNGIYGTSVIILGCLTVAIIIYATRSTIRKSEFDRGVWGVAFLFAFVTAAMWWSNSRGEKERGIVIDSNRNRQVFQPRGILDKDPLPYPKTMDSPMSFEEQMRQQGVDINNIEGPRAGYGYKHGPTPANQRPLQTSELMRSAAMYNMGESDFNDYMARLEGRAPDQFVQAHAYHPLSAQWDHRSQVDDAERVFGIASAPGRHSMKFKAVDPRIQQAGAKTSHLKDPPPGAVEPIDRVHPWLDNERASGSSFDMDVYATRMTGGGKIGSVDAASIESTRNQEDQFYSSLHGQKPSSPDDLPPELEPIPTTREGMAELIKKREERARRSTEAQKHGYDPNAQPPPYVNQPPAPRPVEYPGLRNESATARGRTAGVSMGAPPPLPRSEEQTANDMFSSFFQVKSQPGEKELQQAQMDHRN